MTTPNLTSHSRMMQVPNDGGGSGFRGLQLVGPPYFGTQGIADGATDEIVLTGGSLPPLQDTDGIGSGDAGIVPSGMAGWWRINARCKVYKNTAGGAGFQLFLMLNGSPLDHDDMTDNDPVGGGQHAMIIPSLIAELAVGDRVSLSGAAFVMGGAFAIYDPRLTMEFLGPA